MSMKEGNNELNSKDVIYTLELNQVYVNPSGIKVMRVPGGWIYSFRHFGGSKTHYSKTKNEKFIDYNYTHTSTFVPYNDEFKVKK